MARSTLSSHASMSLGVLLLASCQVSSVETGQSGPPLAPTISASGPAARMCELLSVSEVAAASESEVIVVENASNERVCTYRVLDEATPFDIAFRTEDTFENLQTVRNAFPDGTRIAVADDAYWSPSVSALWMSADGRLYAIQVLGPVESAHAMDVAQAIARAVADRL